ncbi:hypothetical protein AMATHDRAFT_69028 [Amanita thiersii Skay4041]|uniref:Uncharacterized protein n=1 Tax=Amanita thiersii Skay4041 TaxID=703135 RepID=A0A2A9NEV8_9AGAR|nr:hypothetical protein AMATHDRAFT_69028 [Amanita thiersii Skay4041]
MNVRCFTCLQLTVDAESCVGGRDTDNDNDDDDAVSSLTWTVYFDQIRPVPRFSVQYIPGQAYRTGKKTQPGPLQPPHYHHHH